ncbi:MAG: metallophosphoesterase [Phycisphaerae bacterium]
MRWIIGDIHGMLRPLETILDAVRRADSRPDFLFCGDYVNRGPDSHGVIELLRQLPNARFIRGNHDDMFDLVVNHQSYAHNPHRPTPVAAFADMYNHGMGQTFQSYGASTEQIRAAARAGTEDALAELADHVPDNHRRFTRDLEPLAVDDDLLVGHGYWPPGMPNDMADPTALLFEPEARSRLIWGRFSTQELEADKPWRRRGYFGHTPTMNYPPDLRGNDRRPARGPWLTLVDTGAFHPTGGRLSAVCHETGQLLQATRTGELL